MMLPIKYCLDEQNLSGAPHGGVRARTKRNHGANHGGNIIDQAEVEWIDPAFAAQNNRLSLEI